MRAAAAANEPREKIALRQGARVGVQKLAGYTRELYVNGRFNPAEFGLRAHAPRQMRICLDTKMAHSGNLGQRDCRKFDAVDQRRITGDATRLRPSFRARRQDCSRRHTPGGTATQGDAAARINRPMCDGRHIG